MYFFHQQHPAFFLIMRETLMLILSTPNTIILFLCILKAIMELKQLSQELLKNYVSKKLLLEKKLCIKEITV